MRPEEIDDMLLTTLADQRLTRTERQALKQVVSDLDLNPEQHAFWRHRAFAIARQELAKARGMAGAGEILDWVEEVMKAITPPPPPSADLEDVAVHFSPGTGCLDCINKLTREARESIDVCVFTITDNRLAKPLLSSHKRGVAIRIITDDDKSLDLGSDIERLRSAGIRVKSDGSEHHMHHKYAIFDRRTMVTGSYNWTRSAAEFNRENLVVTSDARMVTAFRKNFEELWTLFD
jgi:phosphatidylserine/phosphatidylglycerophosphate/cardiolipin synthase-like enzyme